MSAFFRSEKTYLSDVILTKSPHHVQRSRYNRVRLLWTLYTETEHAIDHYRSTPLCYFFLSESFLFSRLGSLQGQSMASRDLCHWTFHRPCTESEILVDNCKTWLSAFAMCDVSLQYRIKSRAFSLVWFFWCFDSFIEIPAFHVRRGKSKGKGDCNKIVMVKRVCQNLFFLKLLTPVYSF